MTQEDKDLLLKDLCARLPYGVILNCCNIVSETLTLLDYNGLVNNDYDIDEVKPYLLPISSMTDEQIYKSPFGYATMDTIRQDDVWSTITIGGKEYYHIVDWLNKNHFDYRGLIEKGLAIDATSKNIY